MRKLLKPVCEREKFIKNKNNYNKFLIKNNQQNYNKIITRKNHTISSGLFGGGGGPRGNKPQNIFELLCALSAIGIYNSYNSKEKK